MRQNEENGGLTVADKKLRGFNILGFLNKRYFASR